MEEVNLKEIGKAKGAVVVRGGNEETNRKIVSNRKVDVLVGAEVVGRDFMFQRNSGLNQVLCKLAKENDVAIGFSFKDLLNSKDKGALLGKMMQNVRLCRKYKVRMFLFEADRMVFKSFGNVLGMNGKEVKNSVFRERFK